MSLFRKVVALGLAAVLAAAGAAQAAAAEVTRRTILPNTRYATTLYVIDSGRPGPTVWISGGVHGSELAGWKAAERIAFLGVSCTLPPNAAASDERPGVAPIRVFTRFVVDTVTLEENPGIAPYVETEALEEDAARVEAAVRDAARAADRVVVGIHWGVPHGWVAQFQDVLASYQRPLAHRLVDAGADVVAGHHPHVLHGVEWYRGRPIFFSLGNFLFHRLVVGQQPNLRRPFPPYSWRSLRSRDNLESMIARVTFPPPGGGERLEVEVFPLLLNDRGEPERVQGPAGASILERLENLSRPLGTRLDIDGDGGRATIHAEEAAA